MSGDVQPRKRKDKRRKKEGSSLGNIHDHHESVNFHKFKRSESDEKKVFDLPDQGEKIHVQNEHGVGGNICVKIIFFCLFGLLVGAVGLIYMKSMGSTDVDLPTIEESRFAEYFTGWLDDNTDDHEHEAVGSTTDLDEHEENDEHDEHDEHDAHDAHDGHDDHDDHEEEENENEEDHNSVQDSIFKLFGLQADEPDEIEENNMEVNRVIESEESGIRQDVDENEESAEDEDEDEAKEEEEEEENNMQDEEDGGNVENTDNDSGVDMEEEDNNQSEENANASENEDDLSQVDEEDKDKYDTFEVDEVDEDDENERNKDVNKEEEDDELKKKFNIEKRVENYDNNVNDDYDYNKENRVKKEEEGEENDEDDKDENNEENFISEIDDDDSFGYEEIDISEEDMEEVEDKLIDNQNEGEIQDQSEEDTRKKFVRGNKKESAQKIESRIEEDKEETEGTDFGGVAVKLGVGIALIIVAHLVLVKKWKSMTNAPLDENTSAEVEAATKKKEVENLHSTNDSMISRRQTLVPENICFNNVAEDEGTENDDEEEENFEEDVEYFEEEVKEEEFKKSNRHGWKTFEKPSWNIKRGEKVECIEGLDNEELEYDEEEGFEEDDVEEINDEQEEEEEEEEEKNNKDDDDDDDDDNGVDDDDDDDDDDDNDEDEDEDEDVDGDEIDDKNDFVKQKLSAVDDNERKEEIKIIPTPPPRTKTGRGAQEVDEDFISHFEEANEIEKTNQETTKAVDEINNNSGSEEQKIPEKKVGNEDEWAFRQELDFADEQFENNPKAAVKIYDEIISKKPTMIRALIGRARALDHWAEKEKSNSYLNQAINAYKTLLINHGYLLNDEIYVKMAERCIERMRFAGALASAIDVHKALISKYPKSPKYRNTLAVTYLMLNKIPQARVLLNETLKLWPEDGFALVHYGFILKTSDNNMEEGAKKLMAGIQTRQEGVIDGMFFFHLGDALNRLGREKEAMKWYELGVKEGLFLSKYQRSLYNVNRLKGQPWWSKEETTYQDFFKKLEDNWREIRREGLELLHSKAVNLFKEEAENLKESGDWKQLDLYFRGRKQAGCNKAPITCSLVSSFKPASTCTRGQIKFSVMLPNTHVWPHCGPTNCRLRSHLGLVIPKKTFIRVAEETRSWEEGKVIIFDDSFEHEVWHNGTGLRLVLIVDVWHPELTNHERRYLSPI